MITCMDPADESKCFNDLDGEFVDSGRIQGYVLLALFRYYKIKVHVIHVLPFLKRGGGEK